MKNKTRNNKNTFWNRVCLLQQTDTIGRMWNDWNSKDTFLALGLSPSISDKAELEEILAQPLELYGRAPKHLQYFDSEFIFSLS